MKIITGRVLEGFGSSYTVLYRGNLYSCALRGKFRRILKETYNPIAVGDMVKFSVINNGEGVIEELLERKTKISRPTKWGPVKEKIIVSNVDKLVIVVSVKRPRLKTGLIDRLLLVAEREGIQGIICINKIDLAGENKLEPVADIYRKLRYKIYLTNALTGDGVDSLRDSLRGCFSVFVGQSGVGKTSILNRLQPGLNMDVREISKSTNKGKHTTSSVRAVHCDFGGLIADSPGFRDFGLWGIEPAELGKLFREFRRYEEKCKFQPCAHIHEPDCAVKNALSRGDISESRFGNYTRIYESFFETESTFL